jgi:hypothetical protein
LASGIITRSDFSNFEPKFLASAQYTLQHEALLPQMFRNEDLPEHMGPTWNGPRHGTVVATALTEGVSIAIGQIPSQSNTAITPSSAGVEVIITKRALQTGRDNYMTQMGVVAADSLVKKIDKDGIAKFTDFTAIGTAGVAMTGGHVNAASANIRANRSGLGGPPRGPFYLLHTPETISVLLNSIAPVGTYPVPAGFSQEVIEMWYAHDLKVYSLNGGFASGNIALTGATTSATGAVFSKNAVVYVEAQAATFESDYDNELRGWNIVGEAVYGYGTDITSWGQGMVFDSAARVA